MKGGDKRIVWEFLSLKYTEWALALQVPSRHLSWHLILCFSSRPCIFLPAWPGTLFLHTIFPWATGEMLPYQRCLPQLSYPDGKALYPQTNSTLSFSMACVTLLHTVKVIYFVAHTSVLSLVHYSSFQENFLLWWESPSVLPSRLYTSACWILEMWLVGEKKLCF